LLGSEKRFGRTIPKIVLDATANDSDKTFTVPTGKIWELYGIYVLLVTTATVGTRTLRVVIRDTTPAVVQTFGSASCGNSSNLQVTHRPGIGYSVTAGQCEVRIDTLAAPSNVYQTSLPPTLLPAGYSVRIYDSAAIDAAADDMTVVLEYVEYDA